MDYGLVLDLNGLWTTKVVELIDIDSLWKFLQKFNFLLAIVFLRYFDCLCSAYRIVDVANSSATNDWTKSWYFYPHYTGNQQSVCRKTFSEMGTFITSLNAVWNVRITASVCCANRIALSFAGYCMTDFFFFFLKTTLLISLM